MRRSLIRVLLIFEASTFVVAAAIHYGALFEGYDHLKAGIAETVIAVALVAAMALTWMPPPWPRTAAIGGQAFAAFGVLVGLFTIAVGVGPQTAADVVYHLGIFAVLVAGAAAVRDGTPWRGGAR
jgi:hypothetical protein